LNPGAKVAFQWNSPPWKTLADYSSLHRAGRLAPARLRRPRPFEARSFASLAEYSQATQHDQHSLTLDYDIFVIVPRLHAKDAKNVQKPEGRTAVDRGAVLPNITDGLSGQAPDLGALELGQTPPHYGPRR
jgi:hypothetical protein